MRHRKNSALAKKLLAFSDNKDLFLGSFIAILVKILAGLTAFLMNVVLARKLGADETGLFLLGLTLISFLAALSRMGLDNSVVRFISSESSIGNHASVKAIYRKSMLWSLGLSIATSSVLIFGSDTINNLAFKIENFDGIIFIMAFALPLVALYTIQSQALQGLRIIAKAMLTLNVIAPAIVLFFILSSNVKTATDVAFCYVLACLFCLVLSFYWWTRASPRVAQKSNFSSETLLASCLPLWGVMLFSQLTQWSSQIFLGVWGSSSDVALFASAQRTALLTSFVLIGVNAIAAPKFAAMYKKGDTIGLQKTSILSTRLMLAAAIPILLVMLLIPKWLMGLFGHEFQAAASSLMILAIGQFINIATGSVGFLLSMTGHEKQLRSNVFIGAVLSVGLGIFLVPAYGILGGAIATSIGVASQNLLGVYQVNKLLGFNTLAFWRRV